jgi:hypothetical protein
VQEKIKFLTVTKEMGEKGIVQCAHKSSRLHAKESTNYQNFSRAGFTSTSAGRKGAEVELSAQELLK